MPRRDKVPAAIVLPAASTSCGNQKMKGTGMATLDTFRSMLRMASWYPEMLTMATSKENASTAVDWGKEYRPVSSLLREVAPAATATDDLPTRRRWLCFDLIFGLLCGLRNKRFMGFLKFVLTLMCWSYGTHRILWTVMQNLRIVHSRPFIEAYIRHCARHPLPPPFQTHPWLHAACGDNEQASRRKREVGGQRPDIMFACGWFTWWFQCPQRLIEADTYATVAHVLWEYKGDIRLKEWPARKERSLAEWTEVLNRGGLLLVPDKVCSHASVLVSISAGTGGITACPTVADMLSTVHNGLHRVDASRKSTASAWKQLLQVNPKTWLLRRPCHPHGRCRSHLRMEAALVNLHPDTSSHVDVFLREVEEVCVRRDGFKVVLLTTDVGMWQHIVWRLFLFPNSLTWCIPLLGMLHCCGAWTFCLWQMFSGILLFPVAAMLDVSAVV